MAERTDITPETTVAALLEAWPQLEDELIAAAPPFAKLRNPVLRRTLAKVATLRQAARVGGVPLADLIARLRQTAGLAPMAVAAEAGDSGRPAWLDTAQVIERYDARADIEAGQHPVAIVLGKVKSLAAGQAYQLVTGFEPTPLIDKARGLGAEAWTACEADGVFVTTFRSPAG